MYLCHWFVPQLPGTWLCRGSLGGQAAGLVAAGARADDLRRGLDL